MNTPLTKEWSAFFEQQKAELFDYLTRMTGQMSRAMDTLAEIQTVMGSSSDLTLDKILLREAVFTTARSFNADIWNAETSQLSTGGTRHGPEFEASKELEGALQRLAGPEREALLLLGRLRFNEVQASRIMGISETQFQSVLTTGIQGMKTALAGKPSALSFVFSEHSRHEWVLLVAAVKGFTPLELSRHRTADLSEIMQELRESRLGWVSKRPVLVGVVFALLILAGLFLLR